MFKLNTGQFFYDRNTKSFFQEISSLGTFPMPMNFDLVNNKTGNSIEMELRIIDYDGSDIAGWNYVPTARSIQNFPKVDGMTVLIVND